MKNHSLIAIGTALTLGTVGWGWASSVGSVYGGISENTQGNGVLIAATQKSDGTISGTVQHVDSSNQIIEIRDTSGDVHAVVVDPGTQIKRSGSIVQLSEVRTGDVVVIQTTNSSM